MRCRKRPSTRQWSRRISSSKKLVTPWPYLRIGRLMPISPVALIDMHFGLLFGFVDPVGGKSAFIKALQLLARRRAPSNQGMELTIKSVTPFVCAKAAPLLLAAHAQC